MDFRMLDNLKEFYMAVFQYFSKSANKMITAGLNSAVDAKMIQVITLITLLTLVQQ